MVKLKFDATKSGVAAGATLLQARQAAGRKMRPFGWGATVTALAAVMPLLATIAAPAPAATKGSDPLGLQALHNFAICAVQRNSEGAEKLLALDVDSSNYNAALKRFAKGHDYCAPGARLAFGGILFAGDLAEVLLATRHQGGAGLEAAATRPEPAPRSAAEGIGACVARKRPEAVRALIASEPASPEELAALQQTGDVLPACLPAGRTAKFNKPSIRAMYALGAYRLLTAPTPAKVD